MRQVIRYVGFASIMAVTPIGAQSASGAAVISVTTTAPGVAPDGLCSLVEALENADAQAAAHADCPPGSNPTTIELGAGAVYTLSAPHDAIDDGTGLPAVSAQVIVNGHGATVERSQAAATPAFRLIVVLPGGVLTLRDLTLRGGAANVDGTGLGGGALLNAGTTTIESSTVALNASGTNGGGVSNWGTLTVRGSTVSSNVTANNGGGVCSHQGTMLFEDVVVASNQSAGRGGGIANHALAGDATLTVTGGQITGNMTSGVGGAGIDNAAASARMAAAAISESAVRENVAIGVDHTTGLGGGIQNSFFRGVTTGAARLTVDRTVISGNTAVNGGGISSGFDLTGARELSVALTQSEVTGNSAAGNGFQMGNGGGIYVLNGDAVVANSTVSGNEAMGSGSAISGLGGALMNGGLSGGTGNMEIVYSTIYGNTAAALGGGIAVMPFNGFAPTSLASTIVALNSSPAGSGCGTLGGTLSSLGSNVESGNTCSLTQASDQPNTNPLLAPLAFNGASTRTHALLPGSPAIDAGDPSQCVQPPASSVDQRGNARPAGNGCDAGAYESSWETALVVVNTTFALNDGSQGSGRFALLADGTAVDENGVAGVWWLPQTRVLAVVINSTPRMLWVGLLAGPTTLNGVIVGLDGSTLRGGWTGTVESP